MKILCLIDSLGAGGAQRQIVGLATFLKEKDYNVTVAFYHDSRFYEERLQQNNIHFVYLNKANNSLLRIWNISRYIRNIKPDVVIAYMETPSICACLTKLLNQSFKLIVSERNTTQYTGWNERIRFNLFRVANYVVPNSYSQERYIKETFPRLKNKTITIPNFVDLDYFMPVDRKRGDIPEIMVAASIWPPKNTLGFIDAVALLKEKGYKFHISWYGKNKSNIDYVIKCQNKIDYYRIGEYITLKEKTTQIKKCYQESDYFCLPSFYEGTPNVICEAISSGLPVACSNICDNGIYVKKGVNGTLFDPCRLESIAEGIQELLDLSMADYHKYCKESRKIAEMQLSASAFINKYERLIKKK